MLSCTTKEDIEKREYRELKTLMLRISKNPAGPQPNDVYRLKDLELESEKIKRIRDACFLSYRKFILARQKSREAKTILKEIEKSRHNGAAEEIIMEMGREADILIKESNALLKKAQEMKNECHDQMERIEKAHKIM